SHVKARLIPIDRRLPISGHSLVRRIAVVARLGRRLLHRLHDVRRRRQIGIADAEIDQVAPLLAQLLLLAIDDREQVRGQFSDARGQLDLHSLSSSTGFRKTPMPSIAISTTSPGAIGPTPGGVPVVIRSPGSSVITRDAIATICSTEKIKSAVDESCFTA